MSPPFVIAIDGPTASGKGTLARRLAVHYNCAFLDTGALYRLVAYRALEAGLALEDEDAAARIAQNLAGSFTPEDLFNPALRTYRISQPSSVMASYPRVRAALTDVQRHFAAHPPKRADGTPYAGAVLDGRDIGAYICPDATIKLFVTASPEIRAQRRFSELQLKDSSVTYQAVLEDLKARDMRDTTRATVPLRQTDDAILIDTSDLNAEEAFAKACAVIDRIRATPQE